MFSGEVEDIIEQNIDTTRSAHSLLGANENNVNFFALAKKVYKTNCEKPNL